MFGIGLRSCHYPHLEKRPKTKLDWFEAISENYMDTKGRPLKILELMREDYPIALHGVGLSIASAEPLNFAYLHKLKALVDRIDPFIVSDHLCWTGSGSHQLHDLLPFPLTEESLRLVCEKILKVQDFLGRAILIENVSSYLQYKNSEFTEWNFLQDLSKCTDCKLLLDVNNVYVNAQNHRFDAHAFLQGIDPESIGQIHLAGHTDTGKYLFDTHSTPVCANVWELYGNVASLALKDVPTLIERDGDIPPFEIVEEEAMKAKSIWNHQYGKTRNSRSSEKVFASHCLQESLSSAP